MLKILFLLLTFASFANDFEVSKKGDITYLTIGSEQFCLVPRQKEDLLCLNGTQKILVPLRRFASISSTHLAIIERLNLFSRLVGISSIEHFNHAEINKLYKRKTIREIGLDYNLNVEAVLSLAPEVVFTYTPVQASPGAEKLKKLGIIFIPINEYLATDPLKALSWHYVFALFFNKEELATNIIEKITQNYLNIKKTAKQYSKEQTVLVNSAYMGNWYVSAGNSYLAKLLKDAGVNYVFSDLKGSKNYQLSFEEVFAKGHKADFWLITSKAKTLAEFLEEDSRYKLFSAFKNKNIYNSLGAGNNNWFSESVASPDLVLEDLINIFYNQAEPKLNFYRVLN